jgi:hypothetical protein
MNQGNKLRLAVWTTGVFVSLLAGWCIWLLVLRMTNNGEDATFCSILVGLLTGCCVHALDTGPATAGAAGNGDPGDEIQSGATDGRPPPAQSGRPAVPTPSRACVEGVNKH